MSIRTVGIERRWKAHQDMQLMTKASKYISTVLHKIALKYHFSKAFVYDKKYIDL